MIIQNKLNMRKLFLIIATTGALSLVACKNGNKGVETEEVTYLQRDSMVARNADGEVVRSTAMTYDSLGNMTTKYIRDADVSFYWENSGFDEKGRQKNETVYYLDNGEKVLYVTSESQYADDCNTVLIDEAFGPKQKRVEYLDANGLVTKIEAYGVGENDEWVIDYICENSYNEFGDLTREVYTDPNDKEYRVEYLYSYTYQDFGDVTQYTSKVRSFADNTPISKEVYEYDEVGNNIRTQYYTYAEGQEVLNQTDVMEVDYNLPSDIVYGSYVIPWQPNAYLSTKSYDAANQLIEEQTYYNSVHHTGAKKVVEGSGHSVAENAQRSMIARTSAAARNLSRP